MSRIEGICEQIDKRLTDLSSTISSRFGEVDSRFRQVDSRFAEVDARLGRLEQKGDAVQWRLISLILATWITTMLTILFKH